MAKLASPITDLHQEFASFGDFCLTKKGTLIGAIEIEGRDPDGLDPDDFLALSLINRSIMMNLPESVRSLTQYYIHYEGARVRLKQRENKICQYLADNRQNFLNARTLTCART